MTDGRYSVVNGKLMVDKATARVEVLPREARDMLNKLHDAQMLVFALREQQDALVAALRELIHAAEISIDAGDGCDEKAVRRSRAALAAATKE